MGPIRLARFVLWATIARRPSVRQPSAPLATTPTWVVQTALLVPQVIAVAMAHYLLHALADSIASKGQPHAVIALLDICVPLPRQLPPPVNLVHIRMQVLLIALGVGPATTARIPTGLQLAAPKGTIL